LPSDAAQLIALQPSAASITAAAAAKADPDEPGRYQEVDRDSLDLVRARSLGVEHAALSAMRQCTFENKLAELGLNRPQIAAAVGNIVGRMAHPGSELATHAWLQQRAALGELIGFGETITLYDLTNTCFEGIAAGVAKAKRGHSKECRSDCPLVTLAVALDGNGFPRRAQVFAGNASEPATLKNMLTGLGAPSGATVVMDAGIATEANLTWLRAQGDHYVVVSRLRERQFDPALATQVQSAGDVTIKIQRVLDAQGHALLYCHSPAREQKDRAIDAAKAAGFEAVLLELQEGLSKPHGTTDVAKIMERLGRAKQRLSRAAQHYQVEVSKDDTGTQVRAITWSKRIKPGSAAMHPGVYCLRTTLVELDNATLWRTYTMRSNLESVFRSLKTDLGLRPVFHQIDRRVEGHLLISVLAYHFVHTLRLQLEAQGIDESWHTLRETLATQQRVTGTLQRRDGRAVHVRKATRPEPHHQKISEILRLSPIPAAPIACWYSAPPSTAPALRGTTQN